MLNLLDKLPKKYKFNKESLTDNKYIDDNSLYVLQSLKVGRFSGGNPEMNFLYFTPFEWTASDLVAFLLSVSKEYGLEIRNIKTNMLPIEEEYEVPMFDEYKQPNVSNIIQYQTMVAEALRKHHMNDVREPFVQPKWYKGAYKWMLDKIEKSEKTEDVEVFKRFSGGSATVADLERILLYASTTHTYLSEGNDDFIHSEELFGMMLDWTTFSISMDEAQKNKIASDLDNYLERFMQDELVRDSSEKRIHDASVSQSKNIFTYKKHSTLLREYLQKMYDDFGSTVTIENTFEDGFNHHKYITAEEMRARYDKRNFFFLHTLFAFAKSGYIKILSLGSNWDYREEKLLKYDAKIEILDGFFNEDATKILAFDEDKARLYVQGKEIKVQKFKDQYHTLRIIFENPDEVSKEWFFSEIGERLDKYNLDDKRYYNAIYQVRLKLEKQGLKNFFITTRQSVKINQKYLS